VQIIHLMCSHVNDDNVSELKLSGQSVPAPVHFPSHRTLFNRLMAIIELDCHWTLLPVCLLNDSLTAYTLANNLISKLMKSLYF